jgi:hypothetical protein
MAAIRAARSAGGRSGSKSGIDVFAKAQINETSRHRLVVEVNPGDDLDDDDRRDHEVDHQAERRPPLRIGHEVSAVLPEVLQAMTGEADDK